MTCHLDRDHPFLQRATLNISLTKKRLIAGKKIIVPCLTHYGCMDSSVIRAKYMTHRYTVRAARGFRRNMTQVRNHGAQPRGSYQLNEAVFRLIRIPP